MVDNAKHIVIIGGGIIGVCTAYYLSEDERFKNGLFSITVVEANEIASGASGKAGGFLALDWHGPATAELGRLSYSLHQQLAQEYDGKNVYGYRKLKSLNADVRVPDSSHDEQLVNSTLAKSGVRQRPLPPGMETKWLQGRNVKSLDLLAEEDTTAQVHPLLFTCTLWNEAHVRGVKYVKGRPSSWDQDAKTLIVDTSAGPLDCLADTLVVTAGPWSGRVTKQLLGLHVPISDLPGHSALIRPSETLPAHAVFAQVNKPGATKTPDLFVRPDGLVYISGENHGAPLPEGTADVEVDVSLVQRLVSAGAAISDALKLGRVEVQQLCYRPVTPHGEPLVGVLKKGSTDAFIAAGHAKWGISLGPGTGKVMSELILDGVANSAELSQLDPSHYIKSLLA